MCLCSRALADLSQELVETALQFFTIQVFDFGWCSREVPGDRRKDFSPSLKIITRQERVGSLNVLSRKTLGQVIE